MDFKHIPVLLDECIEGLSIKSDGIYVDCTLGSGGHSREICEKLTEDGTLVGIDQDEDAISTASKNLEGVSNRLYVVRDNYSHIEEVLEGLNLGTVDGFLLVIGVSSYQLDSAERGFSYMQDAPLDMRMDRQQGLTAFKVVNEYSEEKLSEIIKHYGEERYARRIANQIINTRGNYKVETTLQLVDLIDRAIPKKGRDKGHPAKRTFQAIRIEVNKELEVLETSIEKMVDRLNVGGRLCIITFHSLEDRIVKHIFRKLENSCICPPRLPICGCGRKPKVKVITTKPILPSEEELGRNKRSKSAKLRIVEKI